MNTLRLYTFIIILLICAACSGESSKHVKNSIPKDTNHFPNIIQVKLFGDTMRLEIEKEGNTLIKHYIDLQGEKGGDNFDDSYTVTSVFERRNVDSTVISNKKKLKIQALLTENYQTEFSKGQNYYFITQIGDTVFDRHLTEWIK